jgi:hypothetical protein
MTTTPAWEALVAFACDHGWDADLTPRGHLRLSKEGSVVFAPGPSALTRESVADAIHRMGHAEGFMEHWWRRRP